MTIASESPQPLSENLFAGGEMGALMRENNCQQAIAARFQHHGFQHHIAKSIAPEAFIEIIAGLVQQN